MYFMRQRGATFRLGEKVVSVGYDAKDRVVACLESGKEVHGDVAALHGRPADERRPPEPRRPPASRPTTRGRITVNEHFQTAVPHIYAAGDVIGFPALASTSMEQGRLASCHMFGASCESRPEAIPYGIYTIPEISMVGKTEQELTQAKVPYEIGLSRVRGARQGPDARRRGGPAEAALRPEDAASSSASTSSASAPPRSSTSARPCSPSAARSTTSATPSSTTRRWPRRTRWRGWTG